MTNKIFIGFVLILGFIVSCLADEPKVVISTATKIQADISVSTKTATFPKLLWEKTLSKAIKSSAISKDGTKIAIADETGYLTLYNRNGEKLWDYRYKGKLPKRTYEFKSDKSDTAFFDIEFSSSGKYIVCDIKVLNTWKGAKYAPNLNYDRYEPYKKLCFSSGGELLWQTSKQKQGEDGNIHIIGGDKYVLIYPRGSDLGESIPSDYYVLNFKGEMVHKGMADGYHRQSGFSEDTNYMVLDDTIIDCETWSVVWDLEDIGYVKGFFGNYILVQHGIRRVFDIYTRKEVFILSRNDGYQGSSSSNHILRWKRINLRVYGIAPSRILWTKQYEKGEILGPIILGYIAEDEKHLIIGSKKNILFYDIEGKELWKLSTDIGPYIEDPRKLNNSITRNAEFLLFGHNNIVRLYKSF